MCSVLAVMLRTFIEDFQNAKITQSKAINTVQDLQRYAHIFRSSVMQVSALRGIIFKCANAKPACFVIPKFIRWLCELSATACASSETYSLHWQLCPISRDHTLKTPRSLGIVFCPCRQIDIIIWTSSLLPFRQYGGLVCI